MKRCALMMFAAVLLVLTGCATTAKSVAASASGKNIGLDGYVMLGELETANPETVTPQGRIIIGRVTYKSRKVGIPADQKVPTAGSFKATRTKSLFGTVETIIEYDWTAGSDADAKAAEDRMAKLKEQAESAGIKTAQETGRGTTETAAASGGGAETGPK